MADIDFRATTPPKGGVDFLLMFLRFEFALKENGFCPENGNAKVDWPCSPVNLVMNSMIVF